MTPSQIELVQSSFDKVLPNAHEAVALFYSRLFHLDPSVRRLFSSDLRQQGRKLMDMLSIAVGSLDKLDRILPAVRALGQRHVAYGVRESHYETVGSALLWTLEQDLGSDWSAELANAWGTAYALLARTMRGAVAEIEAVAV